MTESEFFYTVEKWLYLCGILFIVIDNLYLIFRHEQNYS